MNFKRFAYPYVVWLVIFIVVPLVFIAKYSVDYGGENFLFSLEHYKRFFNPTYIKVLLRSLRMAVLSTVLYLVILFHILFQSLKLKPEI